MRALQLIALCAVLALGGRGDTKSDDGSGGGNNTGDGDAIWGNDGLGGGDNSYVAPAAPALAFGGGDDSGGGGAT